MPSVRESHRRAAAKNRKYSSGRSLRTVLAPRHSDLKEMLRKAVENTAAKQKTKDDPAPR